MWASQKSKELAAGTRYRNSAPAGNTVIKILKAGNKRKPLNGWRKIRLEYKETNVFGVAKAENQPALLCPPRVFFQSKCMPGMWKLRLSCQQTRTEKAQLEG